MHKQAILLRNYSATFNHGFVSYQTFKRDLLFHKIPKPFISGVLPSSICQDVVSFRLPAVNLKRHSGKNTYLLFKWNWIRIFLHLNLYISSQYLKLHVKAVTARQNTKLGTVRDVKGTMWRTNRMKVPKVLYVLFCMEQTKCLPHTRHCGSICIWNKLLPLPYGYMI